MSKIQNKLILIASILSFIFGVYFTPMAYGATWTMESGVTFTSNGPGINNNTGGYRSGYPNGYPYGNQNPRPVIFMLNPSSIDRNSGPLVVAISGNYFMPGAVAKLNGSDRNTTYISSTYLQMQLSYADTTGFGDYLISVYNPAPGGGLSNSAILNIRGTQVNGPVTTTVSPTVVKKTTTSSTKTVAKTPTNDLSANALSSGFLPSNIIQWLLFLLLVLLVIVLWRKIYVSDKEKETPLKHE